MILDTSALVAVITVEQSASVLFDVLADASVISVGAPSLVETAMVLEGRFAGSSPDASSRLALFMARFDVEILPFVTQHWSVAWAAFLRYGKGRHPAGLNFGDCLTYATAKLAGQPLLCLGEDFARTDLELVSLPS